MTVRRSLLYVLAIVWLLALTAAQAEPTPKMPDSVARFWKHLAKAKTITYTMKNLRHESWTATQPGQSILYVVNIYEVKARHPNRLRISVSPGREREVAEAGRVHREFLNAGDTLYINNGIESITCNLQLRTYRTGKGISALSKDQNHAAQAAHKGWIFDTNAMDGYVLLPDSLAGTSALVICSLTDPAHPGLEQKIYFDRKTGYLRQISDYEQDDKGSWWERDRQEFPFWDFDAELAADTFSVRPPRAYVTMEERGRAHNIHDGKTVPK